MTLKPSKSNQNPSKKVKQIYKLPTGNALKTLLDNFGIGRLRPGQSEVIESVLNRRDTLAIMPTGAGKHYVINFLQ